jgi:hypothetical protein
MAQAAVPGGVFREKSSAGDGAGSRLPTVLRYTPYRYSLAIFWKGQAHMVYIHLRLNVADYGRWRAGFDANESNRRSAGSTGVNQLYQDIENPNDRQAGLDILKTS